MNNIKALRKKNGMTQQQLAAKLGVTQGAVWHWESGASKPGIDSVVAMTKIFQCTADDIIMAFPNKTPPPIPLR